MPSNAEKSLVDCSLVLYHPLPASSATGFSDSPKPFDFGVTLRPAIRLIHLSHLDFT